MYTQCISALPNKFVIRCLPLPWGRDLSHLRVGKTGSGERRSSQSDCLVIVGIQMTGQLVPPPSVSMRMQRSQPRMVPVTLSLHTVSPVFTDDLLVTAGGDSPFRAVSHRVFSMRSSLCLKTLLTPAVLSHADSSLLVTQRGVMGASCRKE